MCQDGHPSSSPKRHDGPVSLPARLGLGLIWIYRHSLSMFMGRGCRYAPSCSEYTADALRKFGLWRGGWLGLSRILRCNPWGASGYDPIPDSLPADAHWYLPWRCGRWNGRHLTDGPDDC